MPKLTLIRGLPGSGKTTLAKKMGICHFEADMWMVDDCGEYKFNPRNLSYCHSQCLYAAEEALRNGFDVVVSNTFTQRWEMEAYYDLGFPVEEIVATGNYNSVHDVPAEKIEAMRLRWEV